MLTRGKAELRIETRLVGMDCVKPGNDEIEKRSRGA